MRLLPFDHLPAARPRRFVPAQVDLAAWEQIEALLNRQEERLANCRTVAELEAWILDAAELSAAVHEEGSKRYVAMTCFTEDKEAEKAHLHFVEEIRPRLQTRGFKMLELLLAHPLCAQLPQPRYAVYNRDNRLYVELFRPENIPLKTEETKVGLRYQKLTGSLTVEFQGEEKTLVQMERYLEDPDRKLRQEAWEQVAQRRLQERETFEDLFDEALKIREKIAANAGFPNYLGYAFRARGRFDYGPEECLRFHEAIESEVVPFLRELQAERRQKLQVPELRPWDLAVDPANRPPLSPFAHVDELEAKTQQIFDQLDPELAAGFQEMRKLKLLDLANRKGKAPGGYQGILPEARLPFIFMNAIGVQKDVRTLLHEAGHAFHTLATRQEDLYAYRHAPIEFCEVAAMTMELFGNTYLKTFYNEADADRARREHLEGIVSLLSWIATVDAFQHWIYTNSGHCREERQEAWTRLMKRFEGDVDWQGYEEVRKNLWHRQLHIFLLPFYYVEYGIAQLGALQIWANAKNDPAGSLQAYRSALSLGGSRPLPELFAAAGCRFDFSRETVKPLVKLLRKELAQAT
jgi:oligoendopeptidase F